jgi:hypothetical protein
MLVSRREFLQVILGTAPAVALSGPLSALWPAEAAARPIAEPVELFLDEDNLLVHDPWRELVWDPPTRREYYSVDHMSLRERLRFWSDWWSGDDDDFREFLDDHPNARHWSAEELQTFQSYEAGWADWLDDDLDFDEMSDMDLASLSHHGPGIELFQQLDPKQAEALGLYEAAFGCPGCGGYAIRFRGDVEKLNAALAGLGINVVLRASLDEDAEWGEDDSEEDDEQLPQGMA